MEILRRENELLAFEVRFLKARLAEAERSPEDLQGRLNEAERVNQRLREQLQQSKRTSMAPLRSRQLEQAERDLVILLERLSGSPLGRLFRLRRGFRELERRYLKSG